MKGIYKARRMRVLAISRIVFYVFALLLPVMVQGQTEKGTTLLSGNVLYQTDYFNPIRYTTFSFRSNVAWALANRWFLGLEGEMYIFNTQLFGPDNEPRTDRVELRWLPGFFSRYYAVYQPKQYGLWLEAGLRKDFFFSSRKHLFIPDQPRFENQASLRTALGADWFLSRYVAVSGMLQLDARKAHTFIDFVVGFQVFLGEEEKAKKSKKK
jgi:hypothetical protein